MLFSITGFRAPFFRDHWWSIRCKCQQMGRPTRDKVPSFDGTHQLHNWQPQEVSNNGDWPSLDFWNQHEGNRYNLNIQYTQKQVKSTTEKYRDLKSNRDSKLNLPRAAFTNDFCSHMKSYEEQVFFPSIIVRHVIRNFEPATCRQKHEITIMTGIFM